MANRKSRAVAKATIIEDTLGQFGAGGATVHELRGKLPFTIGPKTLNAHIHLLIRRGCVTQLARRQCEVTGWRRMAYVIMTDGEHSEVLRELEPYEAHWQQRNGVAAHDSPANVFALDHRA